MTLATGIKDISADPRATEGSIFLLNSSGVLMHRTGTTGKLNTSSIDNGGIISSYDTLKMVVTGVQSMSANDSHLRSSVFVVSPSGGLYEYQEMTLTGQFVFTHIADNVATASAVTPQGIRASDEAFTLDNVYVQTKDGHVVRYTDALNPKSSTLSII